MCCPVSHPRCPLLSPERFLLNPQRAESIHHDLRDLPPRRLSCTCTRSRQLRVDLACLPAPSDVCYWTGFSVSVSRIVGLVVGCVVELSATVATTTLPTSGAGLPAAGAVPLLELGARPLLKLRAVCPGESIELALPDCVTSLSTVSCNRVRNSRGFAPACLQHAMQPFWPPYLICRFRVVYTPHCTCCFSS